MSETLATVRLRSLAGLGRDALSSIFRGDRAPFLGMAAQHVRLARGRTLAFVGVTAFALSVWLRIAVVSAHPESLWSMIDLAVYFDAGRSLAHHQSELYSSGLGPAGLPYLYPPLTALVFFKLTGIDFDTVKVLSAGVSIGCLVVVAWAALGMLGLRAGAGRWGAAFAVAAVGLWLEPVHSNLNLGQVNMLVMALVVADLALSDRNRAKGVGVGLATAIKLTPALFIVYLLITRRVRSALVAAGTFVAVSGATWWVLPTASRAFWFHAIGATPFDIVDYAANQSFKGLFLRLLDNSESASKLPWLISCLLIVVVGMAAAALASNRGAELLAVCLIGVVALEVSPISWTCHWVWFVPLLVLAFHAARRSRHRWMPFWTGVGTIMALAWPMRVNDSGGSDPGQPLIPTGLIYYVPKLGHREEAWDPFQMILGNSYVIGGVIFVVAAMLFEVRRLPGYARTEDVGEASEAERELVTPG
jgi:alpha-1,2-mannosyltransferase